MLDELLVASMTRAWSERVAPGDREASDRAVAVALRALAGGASTGEACSEGRGFVASWTRHPSHQRVTGDRPLRLAS